MSGTLEDHPALTHIEKTIADSYRKEIDQEENVWRSLPFFAASLALELTALFQLLPHLPPLATRSGIVSVALLTLTGLFMLVALCLLARCIALARFRYISREPLLLNYTVELIEAEEASKGSGQQPPFDAVAALKHELARQFAVATDHNRQVNKRREFFRSVSGLFVIASILSILVLVAVDFRYYISSSTDSGERHGSFDATPGRPNPGGDSPTGAPAHPPGPSDADHH